MIVRDIENTLTGRHITQAERVAEGLRAVRALVHARRIDDALRIARLLAETAPTDQRTRSLVEMLEDSAAADSVAELEA